MGGLVQQINLYRGEAAEVARDTSTRLLLFAGVGAVLIVLILAGAGEFYLADLQARHDGVAAKLVAQRNEFERVKATLVTPSVDPFLEAELAALRQQQQQLNANLNAVAQLHNPEPHGFSEFFGGLARNPVAGLWFSNVGLAAGGSEVLLRGMTTEPSLVPRLLQTLAVEKAFAGRTFRRVSLQRRDDDAAGAVEFELRSASAEEDEDAG